MVNTSKVLTVSYGTFSCTLEGFDDSFDTMKAIAEYFRDLAADDRYFGAEPPTPDADMLARIAEREVSRRVEAHRDGDKFVLRTALPAADVPAKVVRDKTSEDDAKKVAAKEDARLAEDAAQRAAAREARRARIAQAKAAAQAAEIAKIESDAKAAKAKAEADRVAKEKAAAEAKAEADRIAKEKADAQAAADAKAEADRIAKEKADAQAAADAKAEADRVAKEKVDAQAAAEAKAEADRVAKEKADAQAAADAKAEADRIAKEKAAAEAAQLAEQEQDEPDSIAAKLARIRAVVGQPAATQSGPDFSEDEHADDIMQGQPGDTDLEDILDLEDEPDSAQDALASELPAESTAQDTISGVMNKLSANETRETAPQTEAAAPSEPVADEQTSEPAPVAAPVAPMRARVIKMKREEFEAAIASGDIEEDDDEPEQLVEDTSLSQSDEDELARELAAVEAELEGVPTQTPPQRVEPLQLSDEIADYANAADDLAAEPDVEMDRLMDQASSELEEPDGKKRRNALGHLRAAVASARADKKASPQQAPVDETLTYRDDLQSAVQPRRPVRRLKAEDDTSAARPPLKLVAEQRVDAPTPVETDAVVSQTPVRPRRVRPGETPPATAQKQDPIDVAPEGGTFNEFAEELGATELPDLLEAAAAYLAFVEGKEQFSRPQLMTKVRMVQEENFSREDGLRTFGQLLRQGKIEKISGGRFTVSDRISFKPDTRAAG